jgi:hypothetical protein
MLNQYLISSGALARAFSQYNIMEQPMAADEEPETARHHNLALTYEAIYGPSESYVESETTRTWLWFIFALLLNVVCIRIELLLFKDMMETTETT